MWNSLALGAKHRGNGILSAVTFVERINTKSGLALGACERGAISAACPSFALINTRSHCGGSPSSQVLSAAQSLSRDSNRLKLEVGKFLNSVCGT